MLPVALRLAYDGTRFDAYARNPGKSSVEQAVLDALAEEGLRKDTFRSGSRTDAGVSAAENVVRAHLDRDTIAGLVPALQKHLPPGLWATGAAQVAPDWHPRHGAKRRYVYQALRGDEKLGRMRQAAKRFVGRHDMSAFARLQPGRNPERVIDACTVSGTDEAWTIRVESGGFLWNQVRRMAAAILAVGQGVDPEAVSVALRSGNKHVAFGLAPAEGLLLEQVRYPDVSWDRSAGAVHRKAATRARQAALVQDRLTASLL